MSNDLLLADGSVRLRPEKYNPADEDRTVQRTVNVRDGFDEALAFISGQNGMDPQQTLDLMVEYLLVETLQAVALSQLTDAEPEVEGDPRPWDEPQLPFGD